MGYSLMRRHDGMFLNFTNNRVESINAKVKQIIPLYCSFEEFFKKFGVFINSTRIERDNKAIKEMLKAPQKQVDTDMAKYFNYLTKYSFEIVLKEFEKIYMLKSNVSEEGHIFSDGFMVSKNGGCDCPFRASMDLPCCHILSAKKNYNFSLFDKSLCSKRWTKQYFLDNSRLKGNIRDENDILPNNDPIVINSLPKSINQQTEQRRFNEASRIMKSIAARVSEKTGSEYDYWISELRQLVKFIENDEKIIIEKVDKDNSTIGEKDLSSGNTSLPVLTSI